LDPTHISERYSTGKTLVYRNPEYPNPWDKNKHRTYKIYCHATLPPAFWLQNYYTFFPVKNLGLSTLQYSSDQEYNSIGVKKK
jgi:hypothetical protein